MFNLGLLMKMLRWSFGGFLGAAAAVAVFVSCTKTDGIISSNSPLLPRQSVSEKSHKKSYGAYLAGRVAHLRRDFGPASDYYIKALETDPDNKELTSQLYLILVSEGRVDEAADYAKKAMSDGEKDHFAYMIMAVNEMKKANFEKSIETTKIFENPAYRDFIAPLLNAWNYAGLNNEKKALSTIEKLKKEETFSGLYNFHAGLLNDYFGNYEKAQKHYESLLNDDASDLSLRALQIVANFYLRTNQKDKATALVSVFNEDKSVNDILQKFASDVKNAVPEKTLPLISNPNEGAAEALFSVAATFRNDSIIDVSHMFICLAIYQNPKYDLAKLLLADILENREMYESANKTYDEIEESSPAFYAAQLKKANNLIKMKDYDKAELLLKALALDYDNAQLYLDLGDVLRIKSEPDEAIKYYKTAIQKNKKEINNWVLYYALGVAYEQAGQWSEAEKSLLKAKELSKNHYVVLNYLGYTWIKQKQNIDDAFAMVVSAYNQAPDDVNITDSLGWALYNLGYFGMAEKYLEKASLAAPANPVIGDHLGDVYWFSGRRNEAKFKWQQALDLKDDSGELDRNKVKAKIKNGLNKAPNLDFDKKIIEAQIKLISRNND